MLVSSSMLLFVVAPTIVQAARDTRPWMQLGDTPQQRAEALLNEMNMTEKLHMLKGNNSMKPYVGAVTGNARLGIPDLTLNDGPQGFRDNDGHKGTSTQMPSGLNVAATWDPEMARLWGQTMGEEFLGKGSNVQLGPGMCLQRIPYNGRNFEYLAGEDPELGFAMAKAAVEGIQSVGVIANAKHYVLNSQETNRTTQISALVSERAMRELYYRPFEGAVAGGVGSVMCSYNKIGKSVNQDSGQKYNAADIEGVWSCEDPKTLGEDLKKNLGFEGWVMSDWGATHSASINQGLDMEMPGGSKMTGSPDDTGICRHELCLLLQNGTVTEATVNASVLRILTPMFRMGLFDRKPSGDITANVTSVEHNRAARKLAAASMILLKNDNDALPLQADKKMTIALLGSPAQDPQTGGGGSGSVSPPYIITPLDAITRKMNELFQPSCGAPDYPGTDIPGHDILEPPAKLQNISACCALCTATQLCVAYSYNNNGNCYLKKETGPRKPLPGQDSGLVTPGPPPPQNTSVVFDDGKDLVQAGRVAAAADVAIIVASTKSGEGHDREDLTLYDGWSGDNSTYLYDTLVDAVVNACNNGTKKTKIIVVMVSPGAVLTPWRDNVDSIVAALMPGQEYGNALTDILFGDVLPTGRLPFTMPDSENQWGYSEEQYPGRNDVSVYSEGLEVGYRRYDAKNLEPAFPFGHGLTYSTFEYAGIEAKADSVSFTVKNTGNRAATEVAQLYLEYPKEAGEPPKVLRAFKAVNIEAGASQQVTLALDSRAVSVWDESSGAWVVSKGTFTALVGRSSRDIKLNATFVVS